MMSKARKDNHSFVLRLWRNQESADWRGRVQHAASGQTQYFQDMADMIRFVEQHLGLFANTDGSVKSKLK